MVEKVPRVSPQALAPGARTHNQPPSAETLCCLLPRWDPVDLLDQLRVSNRAVKQVSAFLSRKTNPKAQPNNRNEMAADLTHRKIRDTTEWEGRDTHQSGENKLKLWQILIR